MQIDELDGPTKYETLPTEGTLYMSAVRYGTGGWMSGPSSMDKREVVKMLSVWSGIDAARIYAVQVPLESLPAA